MMLSVLLTWAASVFAHASMWMLQASARVRGRTVPTLPQIIK